MFIKTRRWKQSYTISPNEFYPDQLDTLAASQGGDDLGEARELVADTPEGKEIAFDYYRHPSFKRDYVQLRSPFQFDWEQKTVDIEDEYLRAEIELTPKELGQRDRTEIARVVNETQSKLSVLENWYTQNQFVFWVAAVLLGPAGIVVAIYSFSSKAGATSDRPSPIDRSC